MSRRGTACVLRTRGKYGLSVCLPAWIPDVSRLHGHLPPHLDTSGTNTKDFYLTYIHFSHLRKSVLQINEALSSLCWLRTLLTPRSAARLDQGQAAATPAGRCRPAAGLRHPNPQEVTVPWPVLHTHPCPRVSCPLTLRMLVPPLQATLPPLSMVCKDPISKYDHSLRAWAQTDTVEATWTPPLLLITPLFIKHICCKFFLTGCFLRTYLFTVPGV